MSQLTIIEDLQKIGSVRRVEFVDQDHVSAVEFYPADPMRDLMQKAIENNDTALVDVIKDLTAAQERGE